MAKSFEERVEARLEVGGVPTERWYGTSKGLLLSVLTVIAGLLGFFVGQEWIKDYPEVVALLTMVQGVVIGIVRLVTKSKVTLSAPNNPPKAGTAE